MGTKKRTGNSRRRVMALASLCLGFFFLAGCAAVEALPDVYDIYCLNEVHTTYSEVVSQALPDYSVGKTRSVFPTLQQKKTIATEAFDPQALPALHHGVAYCWYPQYIATVIIAVDRDQTDAEIRGWRDLAVAHENVGIVGTYIPQMIFSAIAYGLEGEQYTLTGAANLLAELRRNGFLRADSDAPALVICYDFYAAALIKDGRNLDMIVPCEGTFSYERGLLASEELSFAGDVDALLLSAGLRLADGRCDGAFYPAATSYESAGMVSDYDRFNTVCLDADRVFRRNVLRTRLYSSADGREHQLFPLLYMIVLIVWGTSVFRRAMQKSVRRAVLLAEMILLCWMIVRLIKFQIVDETMTGLYLWYSYDLFKLALALVALWLAHTIDKPEYSRFPKWLAAPAALNIALVILVFTSHIHGLVYQIDFSKINWASDYRYGPGHLVIQIAYFFPLGLSVVMMMVKSWHGSRRKKLVFPIAVLVVLLLYGYAYSAQIPIARESDITMVTGLLTLLFCESAIRTGLIPVNTKYIAFFTNTTLGMQINGSDGRKALSTAAIVKYTENTLADALKAYPSPLLLDENTLLFTNAIRGGNVFWQEDITGLNRLNEEVDGSVSKLSAANAMLMEEEKIKRLLAEESEKEWLMTQLEVEIAEYTARLSDMAQQAPSMDAWQGQTADIAILLCYVKRRCNLFFREREAHTMRADELTGYLDELAGIAAYSDKKITVSSDCKETLSVRRATLYYDFFYSVIDWAAQQSCPHVMAHLREKNGTVIMRLLPYVSAKDFVPNAKFLSAMEASGGKFALEDLDDVTALSLSFPEGGEGNG